MSGLLQIFVSDVHTKSSFSTKDVEGLKLVVFYEEELREFSVQSRGQIDSSVFRFHQTIYIPLKHAELNAYIHRLKFELFALKKGKTVCIGSNTVPASSSDSKITRSMDLYNKRSEVTAMAMLSFFFNSSSLDIGENVIFKTHKVDKSKEYSFLLSRKLRRGSAEVPVAFDRQLNATIEKDTLAYTQKIRPSSAPRARPSSAPRGNTTSNTTRPPSAPPRPATPSKTRKTCMSVGYVKNAWPEPEEFSEEKQLYKLKLVTERRAQLLHEISERLKGRRSREENAEKKVHSHKGSRSSVLDPALLSDAVQTGQKEVKKLQSKLKAMPAPPPPASSTSQAAPPPAPLQHPPIARTSSPLRRAPATGRAPPSPLLERSRASGLLERLLRSYEQQDESKPREGQAHHAGGRATKARKSKAKKKSASAAAPAPPAPSSRPAFLKPSSASRPSHPHTTSSSKGKGREADGKKAAKKVAPAKKAVLSYLDSDDDEAGAGQRAQEFFGRAQLPHSSADSANDGPSASSSLLVDDFSQTVRIPQAPPAKPEEDDRETEASQAANLYPSHLLPSSVKYDYQVGRTDRTSWSLTHSNSREVVERQFERNKKFSDGAEVCSDEDTVPHLIPDKGGKRGATADARLGANKTRETESSQDREVGGGSLNSTRRKGGRGGRIKEQFEKNRRFHQAHPASAGGDNERKASSDEDELNIVGSRHDQDGALKMKEKNPKTAESKGPEESGNEADKSPLSNLNTLLSTLSSDDEGREAFRKFLNEESLHSSDDSET